MARLLRAFVVLITAVFCATAATAQDRDALRAQQAELYERMLAAPADAALMVQYARVSIALDDYEAAAATLERALIFEPGEAMTHLELGVAYFRLGSFKLAEFHFNEARAGGLAPELDDRAALYLAEIADRTETSRFSGALTAGLVASTNANLGPDNDVISVLGAPFALAPGVGSEGDVGARATARLRHVYDLGKPNGDTLVTDFTGYSVRYFDEDGGDIDYASLAVGPSLSLTESAFGPKLRPFATVGHARVADDAFYTEFGGGLEGSAPISDTMTSFAQVSLIRRDFHNGLNQFDSTILAADIGGAVRLAPGLDLRGALFAEAEFARDDAFDNQEFGLRGAAVYSYAPGIAGLDALWSLTGTARYAHRRFDRPNAVVDPNRTRNDDEFRVGLAHLFRIQDGFGVLLDADYFDRSSNIPNFDLDSFTVGVSAHFEF